MSQLFGIDLRIWMGILMTAAVVLLSVLVYLVAIIARRGHASGSLTAERATSLHRSIVYALFASSAGAILALTPFSIVVGTVGAIIGAVALRRPLLQD